MTLRRVLIPALILMAMCWAPVAGAEDNVNRVVAVVGDEIITSMDLQRVVKLMESQLEPARNPSEARDRRGQMQKVALDRLIEEKIFGQEVKRLGIGVSEGDLDAYLNRLKETNRLNDEQFAAQLSRRGLTPKEYRQDLKKDMLKHKLIANQVKNRVVISDVQVEEYYQKHATQYRATDEVRIRALFRTLPANPAPATRQAVKEKTQELREMALKDGNLAELAKQYSQGPGGPQGGVIGPVTSSDLLPAMSQALGGLKTGEVSPVLEVPGGYVFFEMLTRTGDSLQPLDQVSDAIRKKLESEALEKKFQTWMTDLKAKTYVQIID